MSGKIRKFMALSKREKFFFYEALLFQFSAGLLLKVLPFKWIPRFFSIPSPLTSHSSLLPPPASRLEAIRAATKNASRFSPWKNKCLVQSLAAKWMLNRRKITSQLSLGVTFVQDKSMIAHAWLKSDDFEVVEKNGDYKELYLF